MKSHFNTCVQTFFACCLHPFTQLLSLPLPSRLTSLRLTGRGGVPSDSAQASHNSLGHLGINLQPLVAGPLGVRGQSGYVCRWGEGWFWDIRDAGMGWHFDKHDTDAIFVRVELLLAIFPKCSSNLPRFLEDVAS